MTAELDRSNKSLEVLSESQCRELLASRDLGRMHFRLAVSPRSSRSTTPPTAQLWCFARLQTRSC